MFGFWGAWCKDAGDLGQDGQTGAKHGDRLSAVPF